MKTRVMILVVAGILLLSSAAWAEGRYKIIEAYFEQINVKVNGQQMELKQSSIIYEGSIYVPLRSLSEMLGASVKWVNETRTVELDFLNKLDGNGLKQNAIKSMYQHIAFENDFILQEMNTNIKEYDFDGLKDAVNGYESLREISEQMKDIAMTELFRKLKLSTEVMRSGLQAKNLEEFYLAWEIYNTNINKVSDHLKKKLSEDN